tara:strand:+ start:724 stop:1614 length:891 start_codon:yes stop_codon:yes gene_type:complete
MSIIKHSKKFFIISGILVVASFSALLVWGIPLGIDFAGGSLMEVTFVDSVVDIEHVREKVSGLGIEKASVQSTGESGFIIRARNLSEHEHAGLLQSLSDNGSINVTEERFTSIGPSLGEELKQKALISIIIAVVVIILFVATSFRHVSKPVSSWKYGIVAVIALLHDILIPLGLFSILGQFSNAQVDALFISALLAILGLSVNDTIVVFDRVRENLTKKIGKTFSETVDISLSQTITRSINTSITTLLALFALLFFGPASTYNFVLVLIVGLIIGTYSSIFLASPLLVFLSNRRKK